MLQLDLGTAQLADSVYRNPFVVKRTQLIEVIDIDFSGYSNPGNSQMLPRLRVNLEQQLNDSSIPALEGGLPGTLCTLQTACE